MALQGLLHLNSTQSNSPKPFQRAQEAIVQLTVGVWAIAHKQESWRVFRTVGYGSHSISRHGYPKKSLGLELGGPGTELLRWDALRVVSRNFGDLGREVQTG